MQQKFFMKKDIIIIIVIAIFAIGGLIAYKVFQKKEGFLTAVITVEDKAVKTIRLDLAPDSKFYIDQADVWFEIKNKQISFVDVTCPDKICQNTGFLSKAGDISICMPKHVILKLVNSNELK